MGILKSNREYWDGVMLLGVMMALGVGFFSWTALGILCGKVADKRIRLILPVEIGSVVIRDDVKPAVFKEALRF